jgi:hypothetical protein
MDHLKLAKARGEDWRRARGKDGEVINPPAEA